MIILLPNPTRLDNYYLMCEQARLIITNLRVITYLGLLKSKPFDGLLFVSFNSNSN